MDRKSILIVALCVGLLFGWHLIVNKMYPPKPAPALGTNVVSTTQTATTTNPTAAVPPTQATQPNVAPTPSAAPRLVIDTNTPEQLVVVTNEQARYTFTSHGGGLKSVELVSYPETVTRRRDPGTGRVATLNAQGPTPSLAILDGEAIQGDGIFTLTPSAEGVRAEKQLPNGLVLVKDFVLGTNYLLTVSIRFENQSTQTVSIPDQKWIVGTATPLHSQDTGQRVGWMWFNGTKTASSVGAQYFSGSGFACMPRTPPTEFRAGQNDVGWAAIFNQFFTLVVMPDRPASQVVARPVSLPPPSAEEIEEHPRANRSPKGYEVSIVYAATNIAPGQVVQHQAYVYAGPKEFQRLARIGAQFNNRLDEVMNFGWAGFFSKALLLGMNWLHSALRLPYGWAIIAITVIIKLVFWPLTQASTRSMKRMQALQPQMKAISEKYKDDPVKRNQKTMEFMKQNKVNPVGGCLPMLLQTPVFIGFFFMIGTAIELRGAHFLWVKDLSQADTLFLIPGINFPFNLLPLIMGATMLWQAHLTPPSPGMDPMQQKIMRYMPLMFLVFLYNYSAGLTLYWTVNNLLTIVQTKLTKTTNPPAAPAKAPALTSPPKKRK